MPLCMRGLHKGVKQDHKLRHQGRQQYWLYLKGAGLSMEDSIRFFQNEFTKVSAREGYSYAQLPLQLLPKSNFTSNA